MENEIWKPINGFKYYEVSSLGRIKSTITGGSSKMMKLIQGTRGYVHVSMRPEKMHNPIKRRVHRLVAEHFIPDADMRLDVDHIDEDKSNNAVSNLRMCTTHENNYYFNTGKERVDYATNKPVYINKEMFCSIYAAAKHIFDNTGREVRLETLRREVSAIANKKAKPRNMYGMFLIEPAL